MFRGAGPRSCLNERGICDGGEFVRAGVPVQRPLRFVATRRAGVTIDNVTASISSTGLRLKEDGPTA